MSVLLDGPTGVWSGLAACQLPYADDSAGIKPLEVREDPQRATWGSRVLECEISMYFLALVY
jgi:hypothetical protein